MVNSNSNSIFSANDTPDVTPVGLWIITIRKVTTGDFTDYFELSLPQFERDSNNAFIISVTSQIKYSYSEYMYLGDEIAYARMYLNQMNVFLKLHCLTHRTRMQHRLAHILSHTLIYQDSN